MLFTYYLKPKDRGKTFDINKIVLFIVELKYTER